MSKHIYGCPRCGYNVASETADKATREVHFNPATGEVYHFDHWTVPTTNTQFTCRECGNEYKRPGKVPAEVRQKHQAINQVAAIMGRDHAAVIALKLQMGV